MRRFTLLGLGVCAIGLGGAAAASCTSSLPIQPSGEGAGAPNEPAPGERCFTAETVEESQVRIRFEPAVLFLAPGQKKTAKVVVDPDICEPFEVAFEEVTADSDPDVAATPDPVELQYAVPEASVSFTGGKPGTKVITARIPNLGDDAIPATATLVIDVMGDALPTCSSDDDLAPAELDDGETVAATGSLEGATIHLPEDADRPNDNGFQWSVAPFAASIACAQDIVPGGHRALGPAVAFGPQTKVLPRDLPMSIPINPARLPETARLRHLKVAYSGPAFREPRVVPVTNPRLFKCRAVDLTDLPDDPACGDGVEGWRMAFEANRLGTYQAVASPDAGTVTRTRRITHRAVIGVSMGGAGAAQFGIRHHHLFDVVAPLGGPVDWTWLIDHLEHNQMGGFRPIAPGTQLQDIQLERTPCATDDDCASDERCLGVTDSEPGACTLLPPVDEAYEHATTFNTWWYELPGIGHGGSFNRQEYLQIFRDLTLMFGNPMGGYNPEAVNLPAGVDPLHPAQVGDHPGEKCSIYVDPYDGAPEEASELWNQCPKERCQYVQTLEGYYDDEYNPDGTFPVITFCDGAPQQPDRTPYANWWTPNGNDYPMEVALAVDYNANGVRDELEPVIRNGHERWDDWGPDATPSEQEPGYDPVTNLDPAGDDYDPRYNPSGLEGDNRYQLGEPFDDHGLDGVDGTASSPYDHGEDDGQLTVTPGLQYFWDVDAHSLIRGWSDLASSPLDDDALARIDVWTDGGIRDLFNFGVAAEHFLGGFHQRGRHSSYISEVAALPGLDIHDPDAYFPARILWEDVPGGVNLRYGEPDLTEQDIDNGSGQHVGTIPELAKRIQSALYFIDSRWSDAPRALVEASQEDPNPDLDPCEVTGSCTFDFTASDGRTGPVGVNLPPGYGHVTQKDVRYPVVYMLHGYGMTPEDLQAAIVIVSNWMNGPSDSQASRMGKAILVYVDGRCRVGDDGAECIRGTFFADSLREDGPQMDNWWLELMDQIDQRFRTMGETTVEWTE